MGNSNVHPEIPEVSSQNEFDLPPFTIDRNICDKIRIGINVDGSGIKYKNEDIFYYSILIDTKKEKNYIEYIFKDNSSLIIFTSNETCSEKEKSECQLKFMFKSDTLNLNGDVFPKYKTIGLTNSPFDEIDKLQ